MKNLFQMKRFPHEIDSYNDFLANDMISIGWSLLGDLKGKSKVEIKQLLKNKYSIIGPYTFIPNEQVQFRHQRSVKWIDKDEYLVHFDAFVHTIVRTPGIVTGSLFKIDTINDIYK